MKLSDVLINNGANVNVADNLGITPLHMAANIDLVYLGSRLIESGAECNALCKDGKTPLTIAV